MKSVVNSGISISVLHVRNRLFILMIAVHRAWQPEHSRSLPTMKSLRRFRSLYAQAKAAQQRGDDAEAIQKYRAMLKLAPHLAPAYNNLGMLYFNQHDYEHAAQVLKQGLKLNPDMPTASALLGMSYHEMGDHEKAEPLLEAAVRANPNDDNAQMALARTSWIWGNMTKPHRISAVIWSAIRKISRRGICWARPIFSSQKTPWAKSTRSIRTR